jgi:hypothetical protein
LLRAGKGVSADLVTYFNIGPGSSVDYHPARRKHVYFWRLEELKAKLVLAPPTDREVLPYMVIPFTLCAATAVFPLQPRNSWDTISGFLSVGFTFLGTIYAYFRNGGPRGSDFLTRFFSLGWVVFIRLSAVFILAIFVKAFVLGLVSGFMHPDSSNLVPEGTQWHDLALTVFIQFLCVFRLGREIHDVSLRAAGTRQTASAISV